jgi:predicted glycosyltransferase
LKKILVYSHDTFGLGNIKRMLDISKHLVAAHSDVSVLIVSGSPMLHAFRIPPRIDYIKLPCLARTITGSYDTKFLELDYEETIRLRANLIVSTVLDFSPDLILVDKKPFGVSNELYGALELLQRRGARPKVVLLLRDILDSPEVTAEVWRKNRYHEAVERFYDQILVVGSPEIFDLSGEYRFPASSRSKVRFCGYLGREPGARCREQIRRELGAADGHLVLVTAGGGEDGYRLLSSYLHGLNDLPDGSPGFKTLLVCGPEMSEPHRLSIHNAARRPDVLVQDFNSDMMGCMDAADLVVSMGGYNTLCEIFTLHKRAIVVPRIMPVQEQWIRADRMARLGLLRAMHPDELTPAGLIHAVQEELGVSNVRPRSLYEVDLAGMSRIAESVHELLHDSRELINTSALSAPDELLESVLTKSWG